MKELPTGQEWRDKMSKGDPELYKELVARFGFDFALNRWLVCVYGRHASDADVEQNRAAIEAMFRRKIGIAAASDATITIGEGVLELLANENSGKLYGDDSESILRGVPWA